MNKKNFKIICELSTFMLILISSLNLFADSYQGEIMVTVCGMTGQNKSWTVNATALSSTRWKIVNNQCYITTGYSSASVSGIGNDAMPNGFRCPGSHSGDGRDLAFSEYRFSWDLPSPHSDPVPITIDMRDADWTRNYSSPYDITIRYNITESKYEVRIGGSGNPFNELSDDKIWEILDEAPPNKDSFQPTAPRNFECKSSTGHPDFDWDTPSQPTGATTFYYNIYRNADGGAYYCVASALTATS